MDSQYRETSGIRPPAEALLRAIGRKSVASDRQWKVKQRGNLARSCFEIVLIYWRAELQFGRQGDLDGGLQPLKLQGLKPRPYGAFRRD